MGHEGGEHRAVFRILAALKTAAVGQEFGVMCRALLRCFIAGPAGGLADRTGLPDGVDQYPNLEFVDPLRRVFDLPLAEAVDPLGVLFGFKIEMYCMHEIVVWRASSGSLPMTSTRPWYRFNLQDDLSPHSGCLALGTIGHQDG
jgi:hypothetical protein